MRKLICLTLWSTLIVSAAYSGTITQFTDRSTFDSAVGSATVEDFTDSSHFPITTGVLNSSTNLVVASGTPITPGMIQPGVAYSTTVSGNMYPYDFNIDAGGGFTGGFLDSLVQPNSGRVLTVTFDGPVTAFGFDTNSLIGKTFDITIFFAGGGSFTDTISAPATAQLGFFGFQSSAKDIVSADLHGDYSTSFGFALDNFTFTDVGGTNPGEVPEPSTVVLLISGLLGIGVLRRKNRVGR